MLSARTKCSLSPSARTLGWCYYRWSMENFRDASLDLKLYQEELHHRISQIRAERPDHDFTAVELANKLGIQPDSLAFRNIIALLEGEQSPG